MAGRINALFSNCSSSTLTPNGTTQADARQLHWGDNFITGADAVKGLKLPPARAGRVVRVFNLSDTAIVPVFPALGETINGGTANASVAFHSKTNAIFASKAVGGYSTLPSQIARTAADPLLISPYRLGFGRGMLPQALEAAGAEGTLSETMLVTGTVAPLRIAPLFANAVLFATTPYGEIDNSTGNVKARFAWERCLSPTTGTIVQGQIGGVDQGTIVSGTVVQGDWISGSAWAGGVGGRWPASTLFSFKCEAVGSTPGTTRWPNGPTKTTTYTDVFGVTGARADLNGKGTIANLGSRVYTQGAMDLTSLTPTTASYAPIGWVCEWHPADIAAGIVPLAIATIGDSITDTYSGAAPINWAAAGSDFTGNYMTRLARANGYGYCQMALASSQPIRGYSVNAKMRKAIMPFLDILVLQGGTNEIAVGALTGGAIYTNVQLIAADAAARGVRKVIGCSLIPRCTNVDNGLTANNPPISAAFDTGGDTDIYTALLSAGAGTTTGVDVFVDQNLAVSAGSATSLAVVGGLSGAHNRHLWDFNGVNNFATSSDLVHPRGTNAAPQPNGVARMSNYVAPSLV